MTREPTPVYTNRLQCVECGRVSPENERGWTEKAERGLSLDEALAFAAVLAAAPAHLLSPRDGERVWLTDDMATEGEGMRAWLLHGLEFIATASDYHRGEHAKVLERVVLAHAQALLDAHQGERQRRRELTTRGVREDGCPLSA